MFKGMVIRKCLLPAAVVVAEVKLSQGNTSAEPQGNVCRPSELPIYTPDQQINENVLTSTEEPNIVETSFRNARKLLTQYSDEIKAYEKVATESFNESKQNVEWLVDYLRQEDNTLPKAGAIGIGVLTGLIFGLRGGFFKRTLYATTGGLGMAAICYPKEAAEYTQIGLTESKKYLTIAYNFAYGDKSQQETAVNVSYDQTSVLQTTQAEVLTLLPEAQISPECTNPESHPDLNNKTT